jgi:iron complex outermembrane receptor protein
MFAPVHGAPKPSFPPADEDTDRLSSRSYGFYAQDQVDLGRKFKALIGARYSLERGEAFFRISDDDAFTPRVGLVFQPSPSLSLYASYSTSYLSNSAFDVRFDGSPVEPQRGKQLEAGLKADLADDRVTLTLAAYELRKTNVPIPDPANPGFVLVEGEQGGPGLELDFSARPGGGWSLFGNASLTDATVIKSNNAQEGNRLPNFPRASGRLWASWTAREGGFRGLGFGAGIRAKGEQQGDAGNTFQVDSYVLVDAAVFFDRTRWRLTVNVKNLFDTEYFESGSFLRTVVPGTPFSVLATLSFRP